VAKGRRKVPGTRMALLVALSLLVAGVGTLTITAGVAGAVRFENNGGGSGLPKGLPVFEPNPTSGWYALGDSYMSGEGTFHYYANTNSGNDYCHRSPDSYAAMLGVKENADTRHSHFLACSGATIADVTSGYQGEPSQVDAVSSSARLILLSAGGDSLGFDPVLTTCVTEPQPRSQTAQGHPTPAPHPLSGRQKGSPCQSAVTAAEGEIPKFRKQLIRLLQALHHKAPKAWILLMEYPQLFPDHPTDPCSDLQQPQERILNGAAQVLDSQLIDAASTSAFSKGVPVQTVHVLHAFASHELCGGQFNPFYTNDMNGLTTRNHLTGLVGLSQQHSNCHVVTTVVHSIGPIKYHIKICVESFHPTHAGYRALYGKVKAAIQALCNDYCRTPHPVFPPRPTPSPTPGPPPTPVLPTTTTTTTPPTTTTTAPPTTTTTAPPAPQGPSGPGYAAALQQWEESLNGPAAFSNQYQMQAASDLQSGLSTDTGNTSGYQTAITQLTELASIPITSLTPEQMAEANSLTAALDTFFNTPGLQ